MIDGDWVYAAIGKKIKNAREAAGKSQADLVKVIDASRASLANYESGNTAIYISDLYLIAENLGIEINELLPSVSEIKESTMPEKLLEKNELEEGKKQEILGFIKTLQDEENNG